MPNILVIEDEADIAETMVLLLETEGYRASHVPNGKAALERLAQGDLPQLILLDLTMPVMDGADFRRRQLASPRLSAIPVIILTAMPRSRDVDALRAQAMLTKPVAVAHLLDTIENVMSTRA